MRRTPKRSWVQIRALAELRNYREFRGLAARHAAGRLLASATLLWHVPPPRRRRRSSVVERALGKGEVGSSILLGGTI